jgi:uncharacterized protein (TIGR02466 family)
VDRLELFATPVRVFAINDMEGLNGHLAASLAAESARDSGLARSNAGGWHSPPDLTARSDPRYQELMQAIVDRLDRALHDVAHARARQPTGAWRFGLHAWAMVMRHGDYATVHDHNPAHLSAVYYVDPGDADPAAFPDSGQLCFVDPGRGGADIPDLEIFPSEVSLTPAAGTLVVFPGRLQHFVRPYRGTRPRISISCNVNVEARASRSAPP